jgi:hypothetical protein
MAAFAGADALREVDEGDGIMFIHRPRTGRRWGRRRKATCHAGK